jgi:arsenate reductase-like glutaredoxin family protein
MEEKKQVSWDTQDGDGQNGEVYDGGTLDVLKNDFMSKKQLMDILSYSRSGIDNLMRTKKIAYIKLGRKVFFLKRDVNELLRKNYKHK